MLIGLDSEKARYVRPADVIDQIASITGCLVLISFLVTKPIELSHNKAGRIGSLIEEAFFNSDIEAAGRSESSLRSESICCVSIKLKIPKIHHGGLFSTTAPRQTSIKLHSFLGILSLLCSTYTYHRMYTP